MTRALTIVPHVEPAFAKAQRLQAEAREAMSEHVGLTLDALTISIERCEEIANGGELYPASLRDRAGKLAALLIAERSGIDIAFQSAAANQRRGR